MAQTAGIVAFVAIAAALSLAFCLSIAFGASSSKKTTAAPAKVNPAGATATSTGTPVGKGQGAPVKDPALGGLCALDTKTRPKACGSVNCPGLPSCPMYKWMGMDKFIVGKLGRAPTGITKNSVTISGGLDPQGVLDIVNAMRAKVGSPPVAWDDKLACAARAWIPLTNFDACPHGAAPGFPFYAQVIGVSPDPNAKPMETAKYAIEKQFFEDEKKIADAAKVAPNTAAQLPQGWKRGTISDTVIDGIGHYIILTSAEVIACGFAIGPNYTRSRYITPPRDVMQLITGHFAAT
jgi:hypothetical protein